jgi:hypothetical protein
MYSHEELISAVCAAGRDGKTFTLKDVRTQLGFESRDKKELSRFRRRLRAFEKTAADQLEKLANNSYRLRPGAFEQTQTQTDPARETPQLPQIQQPAQEVALEPASGVFHSAVPANEPEPRAQPESTKSNGGPALHAVERPHATGNGHVSPAYVAAVPQPQPQAQRTESSSASTPQRVLGVASALVSGAFAASAAVSGKVRERGRNMREQLWSCLRAAPARRHAFARLRGWAESVRPLSNEVRQQLSALRQRVLSNRRRAA